MNRSSPVYLCYQAQRVEQLTLGTCVERVLRKGVEYLITHNAEGIPQVLGVLLSEKMREQGHPSYGFVYEFTPFNNLQGEQYDTAVFLEAEAASLESKHEKIRAGIPLMSEEEMFGISSRDALACSS
ncbi:hypothetical protein HYZ97_01285 [Candidatus Pacearchaeota archaeon]|nr:hypothetical protein [Candidatus Pacearchaeota archaeon]